ncbi:NUDIX domain-containing protein [Streptomyces shenzhenensis]|uniref:NUDIX hydrolase n=1 Tax=Streptomyces shenzhenensis TaxID=943815 RepID=UPI003828E538
MTDDRTLTSVGWITRDQDRLLVVRTKGRDAFYLPGGKIEPGETHEQALVREVHEELGLRLVPTTLEHVVTIEAPAHAEPGIHLRMHCFTGTAHGSPHAGREIAELAWIGIDGAERCAPAVQQVFDVLSRL